MNRRDAMIATAALVAAAGPALAQTDHSAHMAHDHAEHDHGGPNPLLDSANACVKDGLACLNHCLQSLATGDVSLADCARSTDQMLSICGTLAKLASTKSIYLPAMAKLTLTVCQDCEKVCRKHADKHATCKACAEACVACANECKKVGA
jgi:Cys-rich four helix bundle protein (predicted Tat secretion target)